jgi:hypothetical protein
MGFELNLDLGGVDLDRLDAGSVREPGWYHCEVADVAENPERPGNYSLILRVLQGNHRGAAIFHHFSDPSQAASVKASEMARDKIAVFGKRLGILRPNGSIDLLAAIGKRCFAKLATRSYTPETGKNAGILQTVTEPEFAGIYAEEDPRVPEPARRGEPCNDAPGKKPAAQAAGAGKWKGTGTAPSAAAEAVAQGKPYVTPPPPARRPAAPQEDPYAGL